MAMDDIKVTESKVKKLPQGPKPAKASGLDEIHPRILKELALEFALLLPTILKRSHWTGLRQISVHSSRKVIDP